MCTVQWLLTSPLWYEPYKWHYLQDSILWSRVTVIIVCTPSEMSPFVQHLCFRINWMIPAFMLRCQCTLFLPFKCNNILHFQIMSLRRALVGRKYGMDLARLAAGPRSLSARSISSAGSRCQMCEGRCIDSYWFWLFRPNLLSSCGSCVNCFNCSNCPSCTVIPTRSMSSAEPKYDFYCPDLILFTIIRPGADAPTHTGQSWEDNVSILRTWTVDTPLTDMHQFSGPAQCPLFSDRRPEAGITLRQHWTNIPLAWVCDHVILTPGK